MNRLSSSIVGLALVSSLLLGGCNKTSTVSGDKVMMGMVNDKCPVSGHAVDPNAKAVGYEGHTIGFCCNNCQAKWSAMPQADKDKFLAQCMKK